jgi:hypothetical protein
MVVLIGGRVSELCVRESGRRADSPSVARWRLAPFHFPSGLDLEGPSLRSHVGVSRSKSASEAGRLHVDIGPNVVGNFLFYNPSDSVFRGYFPHQECSLR